MREVAGAIERPSESAVEVHESPDGTWINVPPPRLPWIVYAGAALAITSMLAVIVSGAMVFLLRRPFPGYDAIVGGHFGPQPLAWRLAGLLGWLTITPALIVLTAAALRPMNRSEKIFVPSRSASPSAQIELALLLKTRELGVQRAVQVPLGDILRFELHRDPQGLIESEIVIETHSALAQGRGARRRTVADTAGEAEKEWLASVLNALLARARGA